MKLNLIDKKLLKELDTNCRRPLSQIAKLVRISQPGLLYKMKQFKNEGIIPFYYTIINTSVFGYSFYRLMIRFQSTTKQKEEEIIKKIMDNKNIFWISRCSGRFDLIIDIMAKNIIEADEIINKIISQNFRFISQKEIAIIVKSWQFNRSFLLDNVKKIEFKRSYGGVSPKIKLDELDKLILKNISNNPLQKNIDLAEKLKVDRNTIKNRINRMIKDQIIIDFRAWLEMSTLKFHSYKLLVRLNRIKPEAEEKILSFAKENKNIIYFNKILGEWEYEFDIETENENEFERILIDIKNKFSVEIKDFEILKITKNYKLNYL